MKWLIYLLLIFNIGFAAWHYRGPVSQTMPDMPVSGEHRLILLSEFRQQKLQDQGGRLCYSLGPFSNKKDAQDAVKTLEKSGTVVKLVQLRDTSRSGYWVLLPPAASRKAARKNIARLKKHKVKDYFLVATGSKRNAVSLGVYSRKKLARARVDEMIRLGFVPRMETVPLPRKVYWLNWYKDAESQPQSRVLLGLKKQYAAIARTERSCK